MKSTRRNRRPPSFQAAGNFPAGVYNWFSYVHLDGMTNRERARKAIKTAFSYMWREGYAPDLDDLEATKGGRADIETSVKDLLTDLHHWAKFTFVDIDLMFACAKNMFEEEDSAKCRACNEDDDELDHTCD